MQPDDHPDDHPAATRIARLIRPHRTHRALSLIFATALAAAAVVAVATPSASADGGGSPHDITTRTVDGEPNLEGFVTEDDNFARTSAVHVVFIAQSVLVTLFLLSAMLRTSRLRRQQGSSSPAHSRARSGSRPIPDGHPSTAPAAAPSSPVDVASLEEDAARLTAECERLARQLDLLRIAHADEEADFRARRRAALLEMLEFRQVAAELGAEEPHLRDRVARLNADVDHLGQRRTALAAEIDASTRTSTALRERNAFAKHELASLRSDRERVERRIRGGVQRLQDFARRRELLRAETEELSALLDLLQQLADQPRSLTRLSDGELRDRSIPAAQVVDTSYDLAAEPAPSFRTRRSR
jgi:hypothetical protein